MGWASSIILTWADAPSRLASPRATPRPRATPLDPQPLPQPHRAPPPSSRLSQWIWVSPQHSSRAALHRALPISAMARRLESSTVPPLALPTRLAALCLPPPPVELPSVSSSRPLCHRVLLPLPPQLPKP